MARAQVDDEAGAPERVTVWTVAGYRAGRGCGSTTGWDAHGHGAVDGHGRQRRPGGNRQQRRRLRADARSGEPVWHVQINTRKRPGAARTPGTRPEPLAPTPTPRPVKPARRGEDL